MYKFGKLTSLRREEISTKQRERVQKYGEVFTPSNIVNDMLDLLPTKDDGRTLILNEKTKAEKSYLSSTFLEPSCGDGNFLVEILNRKLKCVSESSFDHDVLLALSSIYGVLQYRFRIELVDKVGYNTCLILWYYNKAITLDRVVI